MPTANEWILVGAIIVLLIASETRYNVTVQRERKRSLLILAKKNT